MEIQPLLRIVKQSRSLNDVCLQDVLARAEQAYAYNQAHPTDPFLTECLHKIFDNHDAPCQYYGEIWEILKQNIIDDREQVINFFAARGSGTTTILDMFAAYLARRIPRSNIVMVTLSALMNQFSNRMKILFPYRHIEKDKIAFYDNDSQIEIISPMKLRRYSFDRDKHHIFLIDDVGVFINDEITNFLNYALLCNAQLILAGDVTGSHLIGAFKDYPTFYTKPKYTAGGYMDFTVNYLNKYHDGK